MKERPIKAVIRDQRKLVARYGTPRYVQEYLKGEVRSGVVDEEQAELAWSAYCDLWDGLQEIRP